MLRNGSQTINEILALHKQTVARWHEESPSNPYDELLQLVCQQHQFNFLLWHEEDIARSPNVGDQRIAQIKRAIDGYNQQRNDWIEKIDEFLLDELSAAGVRVTSATPLNTETPGSAIDRLSIMSLRIYHLREQLDRDDVDQSHIERVQDRLQTCHEQLTDLSMAAGQLLDDLYAGRKRLKLYRQMKMYNDATLNPYLYEGKRQS